MYFVYLYGRDYNIAIQTLNGIENAVFRSRFEKCNGSIYAVNCDVDITYDYVDDAFNAGTRTVTLLSGSSLVSDTPTGNPLIDIQITNITGSGCTYTFIDCGNPFTTTTTTTTTSTTTTTTTNSIPAANTPFLLKYDPYSSSYNAANGELNNLGTLGSIFNLTSSYVNGVGFVQITGSGASQALVINQGSTTGQYIYNINNSGQSEILNLNDKAWYLGVAIKFTKWIDKSQDPPPNAESVASIFSILARKDNANGLLNGLDLISYNNYNDTSKGVVSGYTIRNSRKILAPTVASDSMALNTWFWVEVIVDKIPAVTRTYSSLIIRNLTTDQYLPTGQDERSIVNTAGQMDYYIYTGISNDAASKKGSVAGFQLGALVFTTSSLSSGISWELIASTRAEYLSRF